jgi:hypothetical protein
MSISVRFVVFKVREQIGLTKLYSIVSCNVHFKIHFMPNQSGLIKPLSCGNFIILVNQKLKPFGNTILLGTNISFESLVIYN